ncbi:hypothetical protein ULMS_13540 [Patiriisocius marinistellae]|uniref:Fe2OG dioxygenase domain-containing protein n=1 Tax=Patiriisocius marinistellae TaxID=2494560 RepID=A0A5J4G034_9FLAO|nr:alpha-ketoglutarate-dependent dioxygenase AlkB [Patiriisocius marinistellae]GEQ85846.1 hypothetical protein ULMS_13540 [Patiriisocius marinistellae]
MKQLIDVFNYHEDFMSIQEANELFEYLMGIKTLTSMLEIDTETGDSFTFNFGKMIFVDKELKEQNRFPKENWGKSLEWSKHIIPLKKRIEQHTNCEFKTCVCIFYPDGNSGVDYHADKIAFGDTSIIPAISLGEERPFKLRENKSRKEIGLFLKHGSLLIMGARCQDDFEHSLPEDASFKQPRISLTFRKVDE